MNKNNTLNNGFISSGDNVSYWIDSTPIIAFEKISEDLTTDVLVIGGGIAGLTTAYLLLKAGKKIVLVEDGFIGSGESGRTTVHISNALDDRYYYLENKHGKQASALAAESHTAAINQIEKIVSTEGINCLFKRVNGYLFLHTSDKPKIWTKNSKLPKEQAYTLLF